MASEFVQCTAASDGARIYVNLMTVTVIRPEHGGCTLFFAGEGNADGVTVRDSPDDLLTKYQRIKE